MVKIFEAKTKDELEKLISDYIDDNDLLIRNVVFDDTGLKATCTLESNDKLDFESTGNPATDKLIQDGINVAGKDAYKDAIEKAPEILKQMGITADDDVIKQATEMLKGMINDDGE